MGDATVWAQAESGVWERIGADRARGIWPEGQRPSANDWGSDTASFLVRRDPGAVYPDLSPATPIDVEVGGERVFSGFVWEPPQQADERAIAVECRGWPYHTDDDLVDRLYVHSSLLEWQDIRSAVSTDRLAATTAPGVTAGDGAIVLSYAPNVAVPASPGYGQVGVFLDLGYPDACKRVVIEYTTSNNNVNFAVRVGAFNSLPGNFAGGTLVSLTNNPSGLAGFNVTGRYVAIVLQNDTGGVQTPGAEVFFRATQVMVFGAAAYESGNASILKASDVVKDLLPFCPLLDQRTDLIQASDVVLPDFVLEEQTPRQGMEQANAVQGWQLRVTPERLLEYRPRPVVPIGRTGAWAPDALSGASRGSLEPIHNRAKVRGNNASGGTVAVERWASQQPGVVGELLDRFTNPGFSGTTGWTATGGSAIAVVFGSGSWTNLTEGDTLETTLSGTFERGTLYRLSFTLNPIGSPEVRFGTTTDYASAILSGAGIKTLIWLPKADATNVLEKFVQADTVLPTSAGHTVDDFTVEAVRPTIPDRRGFVRAKAIRVNRPINAGIGISMADASLKQAMKTPFKGDLTAWPGAVRTFLGDAPVHPASLLRHTGELVHHSNLIDPDSGNLGRDSRIVTVAYDDEAGISQVGQDNTRTNFETQLARYEVTGR